MSSNKSDKSVIIGRASSYHDPAICITVGDYVFAEGIERHMGCKRALEGLLYYSKPAITKELKRAGIKITPDMEMISVSTWVEELVKKHRLPAFHNTTRRVENYIESDWYFNAQIHGILLGKAYMSGDFANDPDTKKMKTKQMNHHLSHAANAVFTSPFEECVVMVIDGHGESSALDFFHYKDNKFNRIPTETPKYTDMTDLLSKSPGFAYQAVTSMCGFSPTDGEEWKVMGLAAYGKKREDLYSFMKQRTTVNGLEMRFNFFDQEAMQTLNKLIGGFRKPDDPDILRIADLAWNFQQVFMEAVQDLVKNLGAMKLSKNLAFAGGCALNSSANGRLVKGTGFERLHVPSAPADDGNALGAALYEKYVVRGEKRVPKVMSPYLGSAPNIDSLEQTLKVGGVKYKKCSDETQLCNEVSDLLMQGHIIGWMQGRAEWGPRALGNRSIIADPRPKDMRDRINATVKFREEYRPLAPSILHEFGPEYFEDYCESPYMERALFFKEAVRNKVPAVVHVDGTGRLQSVKEEWNPLYHKLISTFQKKSGVPLVLNTSFNVMGKPIVHSIEDALTVFYTSGLQNVVIGNYILSK